VKPPLHFRLHAWLCLALLLLAGAMPARGFVVCVEADGCVSLEIKLPDADCGTCAGHEDMASGTTTNSDCPCVDYIVPGLPDQRAVTNRSLDPQVGAWVAPVAVPFALHPTLAQTSERGPPPRVPRVAQSLAHIRSVILLV